MSLSYGVIPTPATQFLCLLDSLQTLMRCSECLTAGLTVSNMASTKTLGVRYGAFVRRICAVSLMSSI